MVAGITLGEGLPKVSSESVVGQVDELMAPRYQPEADGRRPKACRDGVLQARANSRGQGDAGQPCKDKGPSTPHHPSKMERETRRRLLC